MSCSASSMGAIERDGGARYALGVDFVPGLAETRELRPPR
jgi:hypothetical protein